MNMADDRESKRFHVLMVAMPLQGHINPMLNLASRLLTHSAACTITFVTTESALGALVRGSSSACKSRVLFRSIPDPAGTPAPHPGMSLWDVINIIWGLRRRAPLIERMVLDSRQAAPTTRSLPKISFVVADSSLYWMHRLTRKLGLPFAIVWIGNATLLSIGFLAKAGKVHPWSKELKKFAQELHLEKEHILGEFQVDTLARLWLFVMTYWGIEEASHILVNSFPEMESSAVWSALVTSTSNVRYIGPYLHDQWGDDRTQPIQLRGSLKEEDEGCLEWLDRQEGLRTVVFMCFGSISQLSDEQMEELAKGVEASGYRFLWVVSGKSPPFLGGFRERTRGRGLVIPWAPQVKVLAHSAVRAFATHCGWSSVWEAVMAGIPMLCLPLFADQLLNARLLERHWRAGVGLVQPYAHGGGRLCRSHVQAAIHRVMHLDYDSIRAQVEHLKTAALQSLRPAGSSHNAFVSLVNDMIDSAPNDDVESACNIGSTKAPWCK